MSAIPEEVQDVVRGVNVTIVDLIGALLPGLVWFILFATIVLLATQPELSPISPFQTSKHLLQYGSKHGRACYAAVVLVAILLGWVIKAAGLDWADGICAWCIWLVRQPSLWRARKRQRFAPAGAKPSAHPIADLLFPYNRIVENQHGEVMVKVKQLAAYHLARSGLGESAGKATVRQLQAGVAAAEPALQGHSRAGGSAGLAPRVIVPCIAFQLGVRGFRISPQTIRLGMDWGIRRCRGLPGIFVSEGQARGGGKDLHHGFARPARGREGTERRSDIGRRSRIAALGLSLYAPV